MNVEKFLTSASQTVNSKNKTLFQKVFVRRLFNMKLLLFVQFHCLTNNLNNLKIVKISRIISALLCTLYSGKTEIRGHCQKLINTLYPSTPTQSLCGFPWKKSWVSKLIDQTLLGFLLHARNFELE